MKTKLSGCHGILAVMPLAQDRINFQIEVERRSCHGGHGGRAVSDGIGSRGFEVASSMNQPRRMRGTSRFMREVKTLQIPAIFHRNCKKKVFCWRSGPIIRQYEGNLLIGRASDSCTYNLGRIWHNY